MPTKPTREQRDAYKIARSNPDFARESLEAMLNDTPQLADLRDALVQRGYVKEVADA